MPSHSLPQLLCVGVVQGLVFGGLAGALLGAWFWRPEEVQALVSSWQQSRECPLCPAPEACPPPPTIQPEQCVSFSSDVFMKTDPEVDDFYNKRMFPVSNFLSPEDCRWIIENSRADSVASGTALVFPRNAKSWAWVYERIHGKVLELNQQFWHFTMPTDFRSELVEDILLVVKTNESAPVPSWSYDLGAIGSSGKRVLSAIMVLNSEFEGGQIATMTDNQDPFELDTDQGLMWLLRSFTLKKHLPVLSGRQYMLYYWLRRY